MTTNSKGTQDHPAVLQYSRARSLSYAIKLFISSYTTASLLSSLRMIWTLSLAEKADSAQVDSLPTNTISLPLSVPPASPVRFQHLEFPGWAHPASGFK